jgi:uncharacterized protein
MKPGRQFLFRLPKDCDFYLELTAFCARENIRCGTLSVIGATSEATVGYYDQVKHEYFRKTFKEEMEILSCQGNVSLKEGKPFLHLHAVLGDVKLQCFGGHVFPGSKVFAAEAHIQELTGEPLERTPDSATGLALWACKA